MLTALPKRRTADYEEKIVTVTSSGGFILRRGRFLALLINGLPGEHPGRFRSRR
jgi:hypothetical protein